jgi:hypothetical protein
LKVSSFNFLGTEGHNDKAAGAKGLGGGAQQGPQQQMRSHAYHSLDTQRKRRADVWGGKDVQVMVVSTC